MRKVVFSVPLFAFFVLLAFTQTSEAQTAPALKGGTTSTDSGRKPPVLNDGAVKPSASPATSSKSAQSGDDELVVVETDLVTTPVSVLDRNGRFIPGLKKKDFKIFENGIPQKVTYFQSEESPFTVILMIDASPSTKYKIDEIHFAAVTFLNQLRPTDKVMVVAFDQRVRALTPEPTTDRKELYAAIYKSQFGSGTSLYDAVQAVVNLNTLAIPGRKAVVLFTDGVDTTSRRADYQSTLEAVEETDALFYPIRYDTLDRGGNSAPAAVDLTALINGQLPRGMIVRGSRGGSNAEYEKGKSYLEGLAANSGGRIFEADTMTNLDASFSGIAEELRRQYSIGYYPEATGEPGERRKIKIQIVAKPTAVVRAKTTYVIKKDKPAAATPSGS